MRFAFIVLITLLFVAHMLCALALITDVIPFTEYNFVLITMGSTASFGAFLAYVVEYVAMYQYGLQVHKAIQDGTYYQ